MSKVSERQAIKPHLTIKNLNCFHPFVKSLQISPLLKLELNPNFVKGLEHLSVIVLGMKANWVRLLFIQSWICCYHTYTRFFLLLAFFQCFRNPFAASNLTKDRIRTFVLIYARYFTKLCFCFCLLTFLMTLKNQSFLRIYACLRKAFQALLQRSLVCSAV